MKAYLVYGIFLTPAWTFNTALHICYMLVFLGQTQCFLSHKWTINHTVYLSDYCLMQLLPFGLSVSGCTCATHTARDYKAFKHTVIDVCTASAVKTDTTHQHLHEISWATTHTFHLTHTTFIAVMTPFCDSPSPLRIGQGASWSSTTRKAQWNRNGDSSINPEKSLTHLHCCVGMFETRLTEEERMDGYQPCIEKVLSSCSVATGLISVRRLTYLPTTRGALLNPRILHGEQNTFTLGQQFNMLPRQHIQTVQDWDVSDPHRRTRSLCEVHLFNCMQISNQPITQQQLRLFRHVGGQD